MLDGITLSALGLAALKALITFVENPVLYVGIFLTLWDIQRNGSFQREAFGVRIGKYTKLWLKRLLIAILVGIVISLLSVLLGIDVSVWEMWLITGLVVFLAAVRVRLASLLYPVAAVATLQVLTRTLRAPVQPELARMWTHVSEFGVTNWVALAGLAYLGGSIYMFINNQSHAPITLMSKRGKRIGAYLIQLSTVIPIVVLMPHGTLVMHGQPGWWPLIGTVGGTAGLLGMPVMVGHGDLSSVYAPKRRVRFIAWHDFSMGTGLVILGYLGHYIGLIGLVVSLYLAIIWKEIVLWYVFRQESGYDPFYVTSPDGVKVLATLKESLTETLGLKAGETITHVNQIPVHSAYDLHFALEQNPAYAKLQVVDLDGEIRIVGKPVYEGERNKLGLVLVPDERSGIYYRPIKGGLLQTLYLRRQTMGTVGTGIASTSSGRPPSL